MLTKEAMRFQMNCKSNKNARKLEAQKLARVMTGQQGWQGVQAEWIGFSGLATLANNYLKTTATDLRIKEISDYGDGHSKYILK